MAAPPKLSEDPRLSSYAANARTALVDDAGASNARADTLVEVVAEVAAAEGLAIVGGDQDVYGSIVDTRLARLRKLLKALPEGEPLPDPYEVGVIFRITPSQARSLLRTYRARFSGDYAGRMNGRIAAAAENVGEAGGGKLNVPGQKKVPETWVFSFADLPTLEYAEDQLRRHGFSRSLTPDRTGLKISVEKDVRNADGKDAVEYLKEKKP
jgi:hypothetical protein